MKSRMRMNRYKQLIHDAYIPFIRIFRYNDISVGTDIRVYYNLLLY